MVPVKAIIIMGISGAGKSTVGELLATKLGCEFLDADNFHSVQNKDKMKHGVALTDEDRTPWLEALRDSLIDHILRGQRLVLACSALRPKYRDLLRTADYDFLPEVTPEALSKSNGDAVITSNGNQHRRRTRDLDSHVVFVYLNATAELLEARLVARDAAGTHFMPTALLQSQIEALQLEKDEKDIVEVDASLAPLTIVENIRRRLSV